MRVLLVSPSGFDDINVQVIRRIPYLLSEGFFAPHACAAVAALTPAEHEVQIHDEHLHGPVDPLLAEGFDVVGIALITNQQVRALEIARAFRGAGAPGVLVVGGVGTSHMLPEMYRLADAVFLGEAEQTWPRFLADLAAGRAPQPVYRAVVHPPLCAVPVPRWELIAGDIGRYSSAPVQTSRGCPHDCSFCDVIYTFGRKLRLKPVEQVVEEVCLLERLGAKMIYFADDNFAADRRYAKEVLRRVGEKNRGFKAQLSFMTQVDITVAEDPELLQLMLEANVVELQIGVESESAAALAQMNKGHGARTDQAAAVRTIQSYGIVVLAHMIVGADSDDAGAFQRTEGFLREAGVIHHLCHPLMAPPGTRLWYQLKAEGRVIDPPDALRDRMDVTTNIVPARLGRVELMEGLADHWERVVEPEHYLERALRFVRGIVHRPRQKVKNLPSPWAMRKMLFRMVWYFAFTVSRRHRRAFLVLLRATWKHARDLMPKVIFAHTFYVMERQQARIAAAWARELAAAERALPGGMPTLPKTLPLPPRLREEGRAVVAEAYRALRPGCEHRETLHAQVLDALTRYVEALDGRFSTFDEEQQQALRRACQQIQERSPADAPAPPPAGAAEAKPLPQGHPPAGFSRELLDALDREIRFRKLHRQATTR